MTITISTGTHTVIDRAYALEIHADHGADPYVRITREHVTVDANNAVITSTRDIPEKVLQLSAVANDTVTVGQLTLTMTQVVGIIAAVADKYRQADLTPTP